MLNKSEVSKIIKLNKLEKEYEKLYKEVEKILENKYPDAVEFDNGDSIRNIVSKEEISQRAQHNEDGTYITYNQIGEDWGNGTIYIPLNENKYLEIYYST